jgi:hypothetical protein
VTWPNQTAFAVQERWLSRILADWQALIAALTAGGDVVGILELRD